MKISYNWLRQYIQTDLDPQTLSQKLTDCGLEVESIEEESSHKGGLKGLIIGEVLTKEKHPDADRLSVTTVNIGGAEPLHIVCGAPNVAAGQKVVVATVGTTIYPLTGEPMEMKKSKIRGAISEGMICAEDEIGIGNSHAGIMVLPDDVKVGSAAADYFGVENDFVIEIGLTPNRADAASHLGVARDVHALTGAKLIRPDVSKFTTGNSEKITVQVEDTTACQRYSGVCLSNVKVAESPQWLKNKLTTIGLRPINNIVDITNYVLHELGQPLHAFDMNKIEGKKINVKKAKEGEQFKTLDGIDRTLSSEDLMICDEKKSLCIAGVFGGLESGVSNTTTNIFLESAYFNSVSVRKTSKRHGLKTDASFRFERGTDPEMTVFALKRAALLMCEVAGASISSEMVDIYPNPVKPFEVKLTFANCDRLIGKSIGKDKIKSILNALEITVISEHADSLQLSVPAYRVDVLREADVIEEILRIYGYNNIEISEQLNASLSYSAKPDKEKVQNIASDFLVNIGYYECMNLSLTASQHTQGLEKLKPDQNVNILNPLSSELDVLRQTLIFGGLGTIAYNQNRKRSDLKLFEFGKTYQLKTSAKSEVNDYLETDYLCLFSTGKENAEYWNEKQISSNVYTLKGAMETLFFRLGITSFKTNSFSNDLCSEGLQYSVGKQVLAECGTIKKSLNKRFDIHNEVFYAEINWSVLLELIKKNKVSYSELPKYPEVIRDLALLLNKETSYNEVEKLAHESERKLLKQVQLFDVYEGDKLEAGKKSYAVRFTLQDEQATLTDKQIEKVMEKLMKSYTEKLGAVIR